MAWPPVDSGPGTPSGHASDRPSVNLAVMIENRRWAIKKCQSALNIGYSRKFRAVEGCTEAEHLGCESIVSPRFAIRVSSRLLSFIPRTLEATADHVTIEAASRRCSAECTACGSPSRRVHSSYLRTLHDLPLARATGDNPRGGPSLPMPQRYLRAQDICRAPRRRCGLCPSDEASPRSAAPLGPGSRRRSGGKACGTACCASECRYAVTGGCCHDGLPKHSIDTTRACR